MAIGAGQGHADWRGWALQAFALAFGLVVLALVWLPYLPNESGRLGVDWSVWLPYMLAGVFWHSQNGWFGIPWFDPALCGGVPLNADPQGSYLSLPQFLMFAIGPVRAIQASFLAFAAIGFAGATTLARLRFRLSWPACSLAGVLFMLNGFYAARMMVGHLSFAPFMLLPFLAAAATGPTGPAWPPCALRCLGIGIAFAVMLQGGMAVLVLPTCLSLLIVMVMQSMVTGDPLAPGVWRVTAGGLLGIALCAGKLAAVLALMAHVPRDDYPLPGFPNLALTAWMAVRAVFLWPSAAMSDALVNSALRLELHEFAYGVGPAPLLLMLAGAWLGWRQGSGAGPGARAGKLRPALILLLLVPIALNTYAPVWTGFLKLLPVIRNSSSLLRWFAAYILPAILGGGWALDRLAGGSVGRAWAIAVGAAALTFGALAAGDRGFYGGSGVGVYDPAPITQSWDGVMASGQVPPVRTIRATLADPALTRQNAITEGDSELNCYDPLFGYRLERFRRGVLHPGSVFDVTAGRLNLKNPACYVFPGANACRPGDEFRADQVADAARFSAYRPYDWNRPWWAGVADWLGIATLAGSFLTVVAAVAALIRATRATVR